MNINWKKNVYICSGVTAFTVATALMIVYRLISDLSGVGQILSAIAQMLLPFIVGLALAYLLSPFYDLVRRGARKLYEGKKKQPRRFVNGAAKITATAASLLLLAAVVGGLLSMVIPQAYQSISNLISTLPEKSNAVLAWINATADRFGGEGTAAAWLSDGISYVTTTAIQWVQQDFLPNLGGFAKEISTGVIGVIGTVTDVFIGLIICVYTLNSKEVFAAQAKKLLYSLFKTSNANAVLRVTRFADHTFGRFINGMLLDSLLLGVLCFVGMSILRMPYALLISAIVGLFNVVPIFGPIVAAVIGTFFVLLEDPFKALIFVVFVLVIQQLDGNIIAPKILGDQTGLSGFWVIFSIIIGGGLFGVLGMILGVPTFAVIYVLVKQAVEARLQKKSIPDTTDSFSGLLEIDEETGEPRYGEPSEETATPAETE